MAESVVSVERVIKAPPEAIFAIIADASRHPEIDGSGSVVKTKPGTPQKLTLGTTFGMSMKLGVPYSMSSTVIEFEPDRRLAWQAGLSGRLGRFVGGRIWRYELEPTEGGTLVRETWDVSQEKQPVHALLRLSRTRDHTRKAMDATLEKIEAIVTK